MKTIIILVFALTVLLLAGILFFFFERKIRNKLAKSFKDRNTIYMRELKKIEKSRQPSEKIMDMTNKLARDFFKEEFKLGYSLEYSELLDKFTALKKADCVDFSRKMLELPYRGEKIERKTINEIIESLKNIINSHKIENQKN